MLPVRTSKSKFMKEKDIDHYEREETCNFKGETYSVRDNGKVYRHTKKEARLRPLDCKWMFGKPNNHGYLLISSVLVHHIVATAFHGPAPSDKHIVDHIDTNRQNNRPENLRWTTKLENVLNNPITRRRIELAYGSIENFLLNPNKPLHGKLGKNLEWMRTVSKEEAEWSLKKLRDWADRGKTPKNGVLGDWIYTPQYANMQEAPKPNNRTQAITPNAVQVNWKTPNEFLHCPVSAGGNALHEYQQSLLEGTVFSKNKYGRSITVSAALSESSDKLVVLTESGGVKNWALAQVSIENDIFIHENLGSFFTLIGAQKQFCLARGLEWDGEDSIDDYSS